MSWSQQIQISVISGFFTGVTVYGALVLYESIKDILK